MPGYWRLARKPATHPAPPAPGRRLGRRRAGRSRREHARVLADRNESAERGRGSAFRRTGHPASAPSARGRPRDSSARANAASVTGMTLVAGVDSSTQSTKVLLVQAEDGAVVAEASAPPPGRDRVPSGPLVGGALGGRARPARAGGRGGGGRTAARHGHARRGRRGGAARDAVERREVGAAGGGACHRVRRRGRVGGADRVRADDVLHRHEAALAGRTRAGQRRPGAQRRAAARLADLAAGRGRPA